MDDEFESDLEFSEDAACDSCDVDSMMDDVSEPMDMDEFSDLDDDAGSFDVEDFMDCVPEEAPEDFSDEFAADFDNFDGFDDMPVEAEPDIPDDIPVEAEPDIPDDMPVEAEPDIPDDMPVEAEPNIPDDMPVEAEPDIPDDMPVEAEPDIPDDMPVEAEPDIPDDVPVEAEPDIPDDMPVEAEPDIPDDMPVEAEPDIPDDVPVEAEPDIPDDVPIEAEPDIPDDMPIETEPDIPDDMPVEAEPDIPDDIPVEAEPDIPDDMPVEAEPDIPDDMPVEAEPDIPDDTPIEADHLDDFPTEAVSDLPELPEDIPVEAIPRDLPEETDHPLTPEDLDDAYIEGQPEDLAETGDTPETFSRPPVTISSADFMEPETADAPQIPPREYDAFEEEIRKEVPDFYESGDFYGQGINEYGYGGTCGETTVANTLNDVLGTNEYTENKIVSLAVEEGLCQTDLDAQKNGGTTTEDLLGIYDEINEKLDYPLEIDSFEGTQVLSTDEVARRLDEGCRINMAVDSKVLWGETDPLGAPGTDATDHWITVTDACRDSSGAVTGFDIVDSGGGVCYVDRTLYEQMCYGTDKLTLDDQVCIVVQKSDIPPTMTPADLSLPDSAETGSLFHEFQEEPEDSPGSFGLIRKIWDFFTN